MEQALSEKQDLLSRFANCLSWLNQAEKHLASQKPLGSDYYSVHAQYTVHQVGKGKVRGKGRGEGGRDGGMREGGREGRKGGRKEGRKEKDGGMDGVKRKMEEA